MIKKSTHVNPPKILIQTHKEQKVNRMIVDDQEDELEAERRALKQAMAEGAFSKLSLFNRSLSVGKTNGVNGMDEDIQDDDNDEEEKKNSMSNTKAVVIVASDLIKARSHLSWPETFTITSSKPLPFGGNGSEEGSPLDIHDDLKRELAFYNTALDAVLRARVHCEEHKIPFARPDDFFAEMIKSDEQMAKIKDRLIFETKKMEAVEQRKLSKEQKSRVKEAQAHKVAEKAQAKRNHMKEVENWARTAAMNRPGGGKVYDDDEDKQYFDQMGGGPNKKRLAKDKKYGFGGKRGRFKQMSKKSINDMSDYNPKGNFAGMGAKKSRTVKAKRIGKRARDAAKARR